MTPGQEYALSGGDKLNISTLYNFPVMTQDVRESRDKKSAGETFYGLAQKRMHTGQAIAHARVVQ
jgi:hypothetical protein